MKPNHRTVMMCSVIGGWLVASCSSHAPSLDEAAGERNFETHQAALRARGPHGHDFKKRSHAKHHEKRPHTKHHNGHRGWPAGMKNLGHALPTSASPDDFEDAELLTTTNWSGRMAFAGKLPGTVTFRNSSELGPIEEGEVVVAAVGPRGRLLWSHVWSGFTDYRGLIALDSDAAGNIYAVGNTTRSIDFGEGVSATVPENDDRHFVVKLDRRGRAEWAHTVEPMMLDGYPQGDGFIRTMTVDPQGRVFVGGEVMRALNLGGVELNADWVWRTYVVRLEPDGSPGWGHLEYATEHYMSKLVTTVDGNLYGLQDDAYGAFAIDAWTIDGEQWLDRDFQGILLSGGAHDLDSDCSGDLTFFGSDYYPHAGTELENLDAPEYVAGLTPEGDHRWVRYFDELSAVAMTTNCFGTTAVLAYDDSQPVVVLLDRDGNETSRYAVQNPDLRFNTAEFAFPNKLSISGTLQGSVELGRLSLGEAETNHLFLARLSPRAFR